METFKHISALRPTGGPDDEHMRVTLAWVVLGDQPGYFSVTHEKVSTMHVAYERAVTHQGKPYWVFQCGAGDPSEIARVFPELADVVRWHLCSEDGPMHYIENAVYWAEYMHNCARYQEGPKPEVALTNFKAQVVFGAVEGDEMPAIDLSSCADDRECRVVVRAAVTRWCEARRPALLFAFVDALSKLAKTCETL